MKHHLIPHTPSSPPLPRERKIAEPEDSTRYQVAITQAFPALAGCQVAFLGQGWDYLALCINDQIVFRFPRREDVVEQLSRECCLLNILADQLPLPIPKITLYGFAPEFFPWPFVGYQRLPGTPLAAQPDTARFLPRVGQALGTFLSALHQFPVETVVSCGIPAYTPITWAERHRERIAQLEPTLIDALGINVADQLRRYWYQNWSSLPADAFTPRLIHGDLNPDHLLIDDQSGQITGILDFGDACVADPALDFAGLPDPLAHATFAHYTLADQQLWKRRALLQTMIPLYALAFGLENGDESIIIEALTVIREQAALLPYKT